MAKKKKRRGQKPELDESPPSAPPAPAIGTGIGALLTRAGLSKVPDAPKLKARPLRPASATPSQGKSLAKPAAGPPPARPRPELSSALAPGELTALNAAYRGVQPLKRKRPGRVARAVQPVVRAAALVDPEEQAARERLAALVGGGVRFEVRWDDGLVEGVRKGVSETQLRRLAGAGFAPEATLDLHRMTREQAQRAVQDLVRDAKRRGVRYVLIIVGKGLHSEDGKGVLAEALVETLTKGLVAPRVAAFATAAERHGGRGAIAVELG